ncbi:MAG: glycosyltransferase [Lachnospiraceae bacterium]|nr:glycosyltransferase [Lachnospiraceae bacterium]
MEKKEILIVINTMGRAGAEKSLISMLKSFDYAKVQVSLLSILNRGELFSDVPSDVRILNDNPSTEPILGVGGTHYIIKEVTRRLLHKMYFLKFIPSALKNIILQFKNNKSFQPDKLLWAMLADTTAKIDKRFDLCIAFIEGASTYYCIDKINAGKKIAFVHVNYEKAGYLPAFDYKYYLKADYICCISEAVKLVFNQIYPDFTEKTYLFPNIILPDEIRANAVKDRGFTDDFDGIRLVTVGRLHPQKGYDIAIQAFAKLLSEGYSNVRWYVIGDGNEKARLMKLIKKHNLTSNFILLGSRENPAPYVAEADIYIQPSRFEGFPLTLQEALILHKPCLTTNFEGVSDLLKNGKNAVIVDLSEDDIVSALKMLIDDEEMRNRLSEGTKGIDFNFTNCVPFLYSVM